MIWAASQNGSAVGSWTLACSDGTVLSGNAPFVGEVDAKLGADCKFSLNLDFRVAFGLDLSGMMLVPQMSPAPQRAPWSPTTTGIDSTPQRNEVNQELNQWSAGAAEVINQSAFDPFTGDDETTFPGQGARASVRRLVEEARNECDDTQDVFASIALCVTSSECSPFFDAFGMLFGGATSACEASVASIRAFASNAGCPLSFSPPGASDNTLLYELCPASCAQRNFAVPGCSIPTSPPVLPAPWPPSPPPLPPIVPGRSGFTTVSTEGQLRSAIQAAPSRSNLSLYLPPSRVFLLGGVPISVGPINLHLVSDGEGSTLDAESLSRAIQVASGGRVQMWSLTLANGAAPAVGGTMLVSAGVRIDMMSCRIVNSTTRAYGGAIAIITGGRMMLLGSSIVNASAQQGGGALFITGGSVTVAGGSSIAASSAQGSGGAMYIEGGSVIVDGGSSLVGSTAKRSGGLMRMERGSVMVAGGSAIISSTSLEVDGGAMDIAGGFVTLTGRSTIIGSSALKRDGGAITINGGGGLTVTGGSSIINSTAWGIGGAMLIRGGVVTITDGSSVVGSTSNIGGGAMFLTGGTLTLSGSSSIVGSTCGPGSGGAFTISGASVMVTGGSSIVDSFSNGDGGAILMHEGAFTLEGGSSVINSTAFASGGAMFIFGGAALVSKSLISRSLGMSSGCVEIRGGSFRLTGATIDRSTSMSSHGQILVTNMIQNTVGLAPLVLITRSEFRQQACDGALFYQEGPAQIVLRNITFTPLAGCDENMLHSLTAFATIATKGCGETYQAFNPSSGLVGLIPGCSSTAVDACTSHPVAGTSLKSLFCTCPFPEYINPTTSDAAFSPYLPHSGCITPRRLETLRVISDDISVTLKKPSTATHNLVLAISGDDTQHPASWIVSNANQARSQSPWLQLPSISGDTASADQLLTSVDIAVHLSTSGLPEQVGGYTQMLIITVRSALFERTLSLLVSLVVTATVHSTTWGQVNGSTCSSAAVAPRLDAGTTMGEEILLPFTACDVDDLPVAHRLPSQVDSRSFKAAIEAPYLAADSQPAAVAYSGEGQYGVLFSLTFHGPVILHLYLGDQHALTINGTSRCRVGKMAAESGVCVCPAGMEPVRKDDCGACTEGYHKLFAGNDPCQRKPRQVWPFAAAAAGGVSAVILLFALIQWSERRRREREMQLEQEFMAVT